MNKSHDYFHSWIVQTIRDRCLRLVATQMAMPAGVLSLCKLAANGSMVDQETIARMAIHITDAAIEIFLYEIDQRVTMRELQVDLIPPDSPSDPIRIDSGILIYQLFDEWVEKYSTVQKPADLFSLRQGTGKPIRHVENKRASLDYFHRWIIQDIRDRCLEAIARQMTMPAGVLSLQKLAASGSVVDTETIARMAIHITDSAIATFLYEVDQGVMRGELQVVLVPPDSQSDPIRIDNSVLVYQLYHEWIDKYSSIKQPSELSRLAERPA